MDEDFSEFQDRAESDPEKLKELVDRWWTEAEKYHVLPLDDRTRERDNEPKASAERTNFVYHPGIARILTGGAPNILHRSYRISVDLERASTGEEGVLIAHGGRFGGYSLYIKDNRLIHHYNSVGTHYRIVSDRELPVGPITVEYAFTKTGYLQGDGAIYLNGEPVGTGSITRAIPNRVSDEGLDVGRDGLTPVTDDYQAPFVFTGTLKQVRVDLGDDRSNDIGSVAGSPLLNP